MYKTSICNEDPTHTIEYTHAIRQYNDPTHAI